MRTLLLALLIAGCNGSGGVGGNNEAAPLVQGLVLKQVAAYQALKTTLMMDGAAPEPEAPVIQGRPLLLRAFVEPEAGWNGREVSVRFDLTAAGQALAPIEVRKFFVAPSTDGDIDSTANVELTGEQVTGDLTWAVSIRETQEGPAVSNFSAMYPAEGQMAMNPRDSGEGVTVVVIPIQYNYDGSGRLPDTSDRMIESMRTRMRTLYPVKDVNITVAPPLAWSRQIQSSGRGWGGLLNAIIDKRLRDNVKKNVYYYGMFTPTDSFSSFCGGGCVLGLSSLSPDPDDEFARGSIGVGYPDSDTEDTFVHEVGHAHGREHAPCQVDDADYKYPYDDGMIGVWGYNFEEKKLLDPAGRSRDFMGYCNPSWVSDYTYRALFERISYLNASPRQLKVPARWRTILVAEGEAVRGEIVTLQGGGEDSYVERGSEKIPARWYPFNHIDGGLLLVPADADVGELRFNGRVIR